MDDSTLPADRTADPLEREAREEAIDRTEDHEIGSQLTAVQADRVFRGGPIYGGPLHNRFVVERYATPYFAEAFAEDELFDRQRVADIVNGGI